MNDPFKSIAAYYDVLVARHGHSPQACDYGRAESQAAKFKVLAQAMPLEGASVLDVGCGFADFADYLQAGNPGLRYTGCDLSPAMVAAARARRPDLDIRQANILTDPMEPHDLVTANGIFYLLGQSAPDLMRRLIERMFQLATVAVAFNSLSSWAADPEVGEFYADPLETVAFCRQLTPWMTLRHDYHSRDFTIYLYKQRT